MIKNKIAFINFLISFVSLVLLIVYTIMATAENSEGEGAAVVTMFVLIPGIILLIITTIFSLKSVMNSNEKLLKTLLIVYVVIFVLICIRTIILIIGTILNGASFINLDSLIYVFLPLIISGVLLITSHMDNKKELKEK